MSDLTTLLEHLLGLPEEAFFLRVRHNWHKGNVVPRTAGSASKQLNCQVLLSTRLQSKFPSTPAPRRRTQSFSKGVSAMVV